MLLLALVHSAMSAHADEIVIRYFDSRPPIGASAEDSTLRIGRDKGTSRADSRTIDVLFETIKASFIKSKMPSEWDVAMAVHAPVVRMSVEVDGLKWKVDACVISNRLILDHSGSEIDSEREKAWREVFRMATTRLSNLQSPTVQQTK